MIENPLYSLKKILEILELPLISNSPDRIIQFLLTDSRRVNEPISTLFFCLNGKKNSLDYIPELYQKGVRCFVIETKKCEPASVGILSNLKSNFLDADFLPVPNSLLALQAIASFHRRFFHYPVVGITGSNGKTIVKEWLYQLLSPDYFIVRSPKSYNSQIGVPLSVWAMNSQHSLGIFEAGISEQDEMESLERIILPTIGILALPTTKGF
jgi:UDP-N-acetylmuramyl pentapeptide synthase